MGGGDSESFVAFYIENNDAESFIYIFSTSHWRVQNKLSIRVFTALLSEILIRGFK